MDSLSPSRCTSSQAVSPQSWNTENRRDLVHAVKWKLNEIKAVSKHVVPFNDVGDKLAGSLRLLSWGARPEAGRAERRQVHVRDWTRTEEQHSQWDTVRRSKSLFTKPCSCYYLTDKSVESAIGLFKVHEQPNMLSFCMDKLWRCQHGWFQPRGLDQLYTLKYKHCFTAFSIHFTPHLFSLFILGGKFKAHEWE